MPVVPETGVNFVVPKGASTEGKITHEVKLTPAYELIAPIKNGQKIGAITFTYKDNGLEQKKTVEKTDRNSAEAEVSG
ncbi:hypothetical protein N2384_01925 [Bacillus paralicheniformis]|nr:hypothetical protein [Bacillus paralicheniformis]UWS61979.1 hypothetical protein N2384_01925 [Bacillus paralicheniformis]